MQESQIAVVTGASSGIGAEIARLLKNEKNIEIWLVARRQDRLDTLADELRSSTGVSVKTHALDLQHRESWKLLELAVKESGMSVAWLVNNAGYGFNGNFVDEDVEHVEGMIQLNITALTSLTRRILPFMTKGSTIVNIASSIAFIPGPYMAVYGATKAYVLSFSLALQEELQPRGINVSAVCPGPVATEFFDVAAMDAPPAFLIEDAKNTAFLSVEKSSQNQGVVTTGLAAHLIRIVAALLPRTLLAKLVAKSTRKKA